MCLGGTSRMGREYGSLSGTKQVTWRTQMSLSAHSNVIARLPTIQLSCAKMASQVLMAYPTTSMRTKISATTAIKRISQATIRPPTSPFSMFTPSTHLREYKDWRIRTSVLGSRFPFSGPMDLTITLRSKEIYKAIMELRTLTWPLSSSRLLPSLQRPLKLHRMQRNSRQSHLRTPLSLKSRRMRVETSQAQSSFHPLHKFWTYS